MLNLTEFKDLSKAPGKRNKILPVETALTTYLEAINDKPPNLPNALQSLKALSTACATYKTERPNSNRMPGVDEIKRLYDYEEPVLNLLVNAQNADGATMARHLMNARERMVDASRTLSVKEHGRMSWMDSAISSIWSIKCGVMKDGDDWTEEAKDLVRDDIDTLKRMVGMEATPGIVRAMLNQILAARITGQISPALNGAGVKYNETRGPEKKYTLKHSVIYDGGARMRLGTLVHELTHVCIAEVFNNSAIMLALPRDFTDEEFMDVSRTRRSKVEALKSLLASDQEINSDVFKHMYLPSNINTQLGYASNNKLATYVGNMRDRLDRAEGKDFGDRILRLCKQGAGSEMIEYDSVINQSLIWCHLHELPQSNPVYKSLASLASENMLRRARAYPKPKAKLVTQSEVKPVLPHQNSGIGSPKPVYVPTK